MRDRERKRNRNLTAQFTTQHFLKIFFSLYKFRKIIKYHYTLFQKSLWNDNNVNKLG